MTQQVIYNTVIEYAERPLGLGKVAQHDRRRTFVKLAHKGGSALDQVQLSLGHASIQTTERYLSAAQDLTDAPGDHLGLKLSKLWLRLTANRGSPNTRVQILLTGYASVVFRLEVLCSKPEPSNR
jgi:integrase